MFAWTACAVCILLLEDEWLIRTIAAEELMESGFVVCEAEDGDQAPVLIAQDPTVYTLLVTDIHMPGSLDGLAVARLMQSQRPGLPVIYTTGRPDVLNHLQPLGPTEALLQKPFALSDLPDAARRLLAFPLQAPVEPEARWLRAEAKPGMCWLSKIRNDGG